MVYDAAILSKHRYGIAAEALFPELALDDLGRAVDIVRVKRPAQTEVKVAGLHSPTRIRRTRSGG